MLDLVEAIQAKQENEIVKGLNHIGLAVSDLEGSSAFFRDTLGWSIMRVVEDYPAIHVSNGHAYFALFQTEENSSPFDRKNNVGLHHIALTIESEEELLELHRTLEAADGVKIEFGPELNQGGPTKHMMCTDPSGIRIEFAWTPR